MEITSTSVKIKHAIEVVFDQLADANTYEMLMPDGAQFSVVDNDSFRFKLGSMPEIGLTIIERNEGESVVLKSTSDKVAFSLKGTLMACEENETEIQLRFQGDFNPMMAMMVKKPLAKFMESLIGNMHKL